MQRASGSFIAKSEYNLACSSYTSVKAEASYLQVITTWQIRLYSNSKLLLHTLVARLLTPVSCLIISFNTVPDF